MARAAALDHPEPISGMNMTPFIDVMLVLLIMLILTVPIATHKVAIDLPQGPPRPITEKEATHLLSIDRAGALAWDGRRIADSQLPGLLESTQQSSAVLHMQTDPETRYERFDTILAVVKRANIERLGFVGNQPLDN